MFLRYISEKLARRAAPSNLIKSSELMKIVDYDRKGTFKNKSAPNLIANENLNEANKTMDYDCLPSMMMHHVYDKEPTQSSGTVDIPVKSMSNVECGAVEGGFGFNSLSQAPVRIDVVQKTRAIPYRYKFNINKLGSTQEGKQRGESTSNDLDDKPKRIKLEDDDFMTSTTESLRQANDAPITPWAKKRIPIERKSFHRSSERNLKQTVLNSIRSFNSVNSLMGKSDGLATAGSVLSANPTGTRNRTTWMPVPHFSNRDELESIHALNASEETGSRRSDDDSFSGKYNSNDDDSIYEYHSENMNLWDPNLSKAATSNMNAYHGTSYRGYEKYPSAWCSQRYSGGYDDLDFRHFNDYYPSYTDYTAVPYSHLNATPSPRIEDMKSFNTSNAYHSDESSSIYSYDPKMFRDDDWASDTESDLIQPLKVWSYPDEFKSSFNVDSDDKRKKIVTVNKNVR